MLIGKDFDKIETNIFGYKFLEINALYGDTLILIIALFLAYKVSKLPTKAPFFNNWKWFYVVFGIGFFAGGLGHFVFHYWGLPGKYASWYLGIIAVYFVERAVISIHPNEKWRQRFNILFNIKLIVALFSATCVYVFVDISQDPQKGLLIPSLSTIIGLGIIVGGLGYYYQKTILSSFKFLWISALVLIPSAVFQSKKINIHQWFDRNDVSHIFIIISLFIYYKAIKEFSEHIKN
ncbi:MAG: hypothetical protein RI883_178 [Bacteroidota bacterium]|jgi:hypothetical protein